MTRQLTCIVCPKGCDLSVELAEDGKVLSVTGHTCKRGLTYAETECTAPTRTVTTTAALIGGGVLAVKTASPIPKGLVFDAMRAINALRVSPRTRLGDVLIEDLLGTGVSVVATADGPEA